MEILRGLALPYPATPENVEPIAKSLDEKHPDVAALVRNYGAYGWDIGKLEALLLRAINWAQQNQVPLMVNEFGVYREGGAEADDANAWLKDVRTILEQHNVGWNMMTSYIDKFFISQTASGESALDAGVANALFSAGNDTLFGGVGNDTVYGQEGDDVLYGEADDDALSGGAGNDVLDGGTGNDILDGGSGSDTLIGGTGSDIYIIDSPLDVVQETGAGGADSDTVLSWISYALGAGLENLELLGTADLEGSGNNFNNVLVGNSGRNELRGRSGNDRLTGQTGDDTLLGGRGNDTLTGGAGNDLLTGNNGVDQFVFAAGSFAELGSDRITDFVSGSDQIVLSKGVFTLLRGSTQLLASEFAVAGNDAAAATSNGIIAYSRATGNLFYNPNGTEAGWGNGGQFATLTNAANLTLNDFAIAS
jgi:Ca2+-binding RTX toxin-like protein